MAGYEKSQKQFYSKRGLKTKTVESMVCRHAFHRGKPGGNESAGQ
jgi:hypothetical protein